MTRGRAVVLLLLLAGALWILASQSWGGAPQAAGGPAGVADVAAEDAAGHPVLTACAAVVAVASLLLAMLGQVGRVVVCTLLALVGAGALLTAVTSGGPVPMVLLTAAAGAGVAVVAVWTAIAGRGWRTSSRYERRTDAPQDADDDPAAAWDALSRGEDPS